jgi:nucleoside 2-deoxyribosyltransferase
MKGSPKIYIASPLGFAASTDAYRTVIKNKVRSAGLEPVDPWADPGRRLERAFRAAAAMQNVEQRRQEFARLDRDAGAANRNLLEPCKGVLAILDGPDVDSGTAAEIGFAAALKIPVVGLRSDKRQSGENDGVSVNLQVEYFIKLRGGDVFDRLDRAITLLRKLASREQRAES